MPPAVIGSINLFGRRKPAMLTFTTWQGRDISDSDPQDANSVGIFDNDSIIIHPAVEIPGADATTDPAEIAGVDPDLDVEPTGVDTDTNAWDMETNVPVDDYASKIDGLNQQDPTDDAAAVTTAEPTSSPKKVKSPVKKIASPKTGMAARNSQVRKASEKYAPSMKSNKYAIALTQITSMLQGSEDALCVAQRFVKLTGKGLQ
jgi:hypothetical protein